MPDDFESTMHLQVNIIVVRMRSAGSQYPSATLHVIYACPYAVHACSVWYPSFSLCAFAHMHTFLCFLPTVTIGSPLATYASQLWLAVKCCLIGTIKQS